MDINPHAERKAGLRALSKDENEYRQMMLKDIEEAKAQGVINESEAQVRLAELRQELGLPEGAELSEPAGGHVVEESHGHSDHGEAGHDAHAEGGHHGDHPRPKAKTTYSQLGATAAAATLIGGTGKVLKAGQAVAEYPVGKLEDAGESHAPSWFKNGLDKAQDWLAQFAPSFKRREGGGGGKKKKDDHGHGGGHGHH